MTSMRSRKSLGRRTTRLVAAVSVATSAFYGACDEGPRPEPGEQFGGGSLTNTTTFGIDAFAQPVPTLSSDRLSVFFSGNALFNQIWLTAPASVVSRDGLGPTFNSASCSGCHFKDGRGRPPIEGEAGMTSMLVRLSIPGANAVGGPLDEPTYGGQFQGLSIDGVASEGNAILTYVEEPGTYADGTPYSLRRPTVVFESLAFGPMDASTMVSARVAPGMIGMGLLEQIPEADLLAREDPDDVNSDGISGHANRVHDVGANTTAIGRFGWKAGAPNVRQQVAGAFNGDIGITSSLFPTENCPSSQPDCAAAIAGGSPDIDDTLLGFVVLYSRTLAVPVRTHYADSDVLRGRDLFREIGCPSCHVETHVTGTGIGLPELEAQTIHPFTDLLLHDMGEGLADHRPEFEASGSEWRTPPLWGIGRVSLVNGHTFFLHDGRARGFAEAILWHGGEAEAARERFRELSERERERLIAFLASL